MFRKQKEQTQPSAIQELEAKLLEKEKELSQAINVNQFFESLLMTIQEELNNSLGVVTPGSERYRIFELLHAQRVNDFYPLLLQMSKSDNPAAVFQKKTGIRLSGTPEDVLSQALSFMYYRTASIQHFLNILAAEQKVSVAEIKAAFEKDEALVKKSRG